MKFEYVLKYITEHGKGLVSELDKIIGEEMVNSLFLTGMLKSPNLGVGMKWEVTKQAKDIYKTFYKKPNFIESLKGYYCHYILKM